MTARARILALRLLEKQEKNPQYAKQIGIQVNVVKREEQANQKPN